MPLLSHAPLSSACSSNGAHTNAYNAYTHTIESSSVCVVIQLDASRPRLFFIRYVCNVSVADRTATGVNRCASMGYGKLLTKHPSVKDETLDGVYLFFFFQTMAIVMFICCVSAQDSLLINASEFQQTKGKSTKSSGLLRYHQISLQFQIKIEERKR